MLHGTIISLIICNLLIVNSWKVAHKHVTQYLTLVYVHGGNDARLSHYDAIDFCRLLPKIPDLLNPVVARNATENGISLKAYLDSMITVNGTNSDDTSTTTTSTITTTTTTTTTTVPTPSTTPATSTAAPVTTPEATTSTTSTTHTATEKTPISTNSSTSTVNGVSHTMKKKSTYSGGTGSSSTNHILHGDLLSLHSPAMIHTLMGWALSIEARQFWIGGLVKSIVHEFNGQDRHLIQTWTDRTPVTIRFLHHHNPLVGQLHPNEIACLSVDYASGKWGVHYCKEAKYFVCELLKLPKRRPQTVTKEGEQQQHNATTTSTKGHQKTNNYLQSSKVTHLSKLGMNKTENATTSHEAVSITHTTASTPTTSQLTTPATTTTTNTASTRE
ncbi:unnamed protein product [Trichobilharzia regenti]|uniref:C-type lectin domain-containing protein n=1 Tax=Trichobilharzia regenti TaxID=157069 RepID=A0A183VR32_TRIRE|nr:unnamed protein product [Trichobilharzia regenti]VDP98817.1 unnamed protein product [Trichobilharzia regenti]